MSLAPRFDFAAHVHKYVQDQITLADAKAGVISGIAAGLFVAYREVTHAWPLTLSWDTAAILRGLLQPPFLALVFMAVVHSYAALSPRMPDRYRRAGRGLERAHKALERFARERGGPIDLVGGGGLIRWPELADTSHYPTSADYAAAVEQATPADLASDLSEHSVILARIVAEKYQDVRLAMNYVLVAGFILAVLSLLGQIS